jgi:3-methyladenine DNA glycosylase AlkC
MAEPLRNGYSPAFSKQVCRLLAASCSTFNQKRFLASVRGEVWEAAPLKTRTTLMAQAMNASLPGSYRNKISLLMKVAPAVNAGFYGTIFPEFVALYGRNHWDISMHALCAFTPFSTSEFAIRPFLEQDPQRALGQLKRWSLHSNEHVRRLASEGCRSRLPWGQRVRFLTENPRAVLEVLEPLKDDVSAYVRKSVANNLNDISRDHPALALQTAARWMGKSTQTDHLVSHGLRTLLRQGDRKALGLLKVSPTTRASVIALQVDPSVRIGEALHFSFTVRQPSAETVRLRLEYAIDFVKAKGDSRPKKFFIAQRDFERGDHALRRKRSFSQFTTRTHYQGAHTLLLYINGKQAAQQGFSVTA